jgi:hypothetical protein
VNGFIKNSLKGLSMDWQSILKSLAPTVASAVLGPLGGVAVAAIGNALGVSEPTQDKIAKAIQTGSMTPEQISALKELEMKYQNDEQERGFKYADLAFQDRDSARKANVAGGIQNKLFWLSLLILSGTLGLEGYVLFHGLPANITDMVAGRILGLADSVSMLVLTYYYGSSSIQHNTPSQGGSK